MFIASVHFIFLIQGNKNSRGIRVSSYDPDDPTTQTSGNVQGNTGNGSSAASGYVAPKTLGNQRKFMPGSNQGSNRVSTISQNYNEKTMLLSSDDEYQ